MMALALILSFQVALVACWMISVAAFAAIQTHQRRATTPTRFGSNIPGISRVIQTANIASRSLSAKKEDDDEEHSDPWLNDQREGMSGAFSALDSLSGDDFDDLRPLSSTSNEGSTDGSSGFNMETLAEMMEMQAELSTRGEEGMYDDIMGDLSGDNLEIDAPKTSLTEDVTGSGQTLDEALDCADASVLNDADGLGTLGSTEDNPVVLTTADVANDILSQEIKPSRSMEEFISSAVEEAVAEIDDDSKKSSPARVGRTDDIAKTAEELLQDDDLRKGIEEIFDRADEKLRWEVELMKKEQEAVTQDSSKRDLEYLASENQRISEAEASVSRMIQKVAKETDEVQKAMDGLETAKNQVSGGGIENTAIDLKKGGLIKQAAAVGGLLFGSRAFTETILVVGSPYGDEHFVPAIIQAAIALACAAYFFLVK